MWAVRLAPLELQLVPLQSLRASLCRLPVGMGAMVSVGSVASTVTLAVVAEVVAAETAAVVACFLHSAHHLAPVQRAMPTEVEPALAAEHSSLSVALPVGWTVALMLELPTAALL